MKNQENLSKLPKWAQERIRVLEMRLQESQATIKAMFPGSISNVLWRGENHYPLPPNSSIRFFLAGKIVDVRIDEEKLYINGSLLHLNVKPVATNAIYVELE